MSRCVAGREVSNRVVLGVLEVCRRRGIATEPLLAGLALSEGLSNPRGRHAWDEFAAFMERLQDAAGGPLEAGLLCGETVETSPWMRLLGRLFLDARDLYVFGQERITRALYSEALGFTVRELPADWIEIATHIREPFRPCLPFWYASAETLRVYPRLIGREPAQVDSEISERAATFRMRVPPSRSLVSRARSAFWNAAQLAGVAPETLSAAIEVGFDRSVPTAPAQVIGHRLASQTSTLALADELQAVMSEYFCCRSTQLWMRAGDGELVPLDGSNPAPARSGGRTLRSLVFAGQEVGRLEVDLYAAEESPLFEALLPWIAMAVENCRRLLAMEAARAEAEKRADDGRLVDWAHAWSLTPREVEVLEMLARGKANKEIAAALSTSVKTVEVHVSNLLRKAGAESRAAVIARFWAGPPPGEPRAGG